MFPVLLFAQNAQDIYVSFPATKASLGTDSVKIWIHIPANYPQSGGGVLVGMHGIGDPDSSDKIRSYLTATSDNYNLLLACPEPYLSREVDSLLNKSKDVVNETMDYVSDLYQTDLSQTYLCGYSAGSDVASHYTLEDPEYPVKGLVWFAPGYHGSLLFPNIDTAFAAPIPPICMCRGTDDMISQSAAATIEDLFSGSEVPFLKVSPQGIGHTMNYPAFTSDMKTCMDFINNNYSTSIAKYNSLEAKVFPNPTKDKLFIESTSSSILSVEITDLQGRILFNDIISASGSRIISLNHLNRGMYLLRIIDDSGNYSLKKFIKE